MTKENISVSISTKVWDRARINLMTPGYAISFATDKAIRPGYGMFRIPHKEGTNDQQRYCYSKL